MPAIQEGGRGFTQGMAQVFQGRVGCLVHQARQQVRFLEHQQQFHGLLQPGATSHLQDPFSPGLVLGLRDQRCQVLVGKNVGLRARTPYLLVRNRPVIKYER